MAVYYVTAAVPVRCDVCLDDFPSSQDYEWHTRTVAHKEATARHGASAGSGSAPTNDPNNITGFPAAPGYLECSVCHKSVHVDVWISHTARHVGVAKKGALDAAMAESEQDRNGVSVSYKNGIDFGVLDPEEVRHPELMRTADVRIQATAQVNVGLYSATLASSASGDHHGVKYVFLEFGPARNRN